jgi:hypothetical protein
MSKCENCQNYYETYSKKCVDCKDSIYLKDNYLPLSKSMSHRLSVQDPDKKTQYKKEIAKWITKNGYNLVPADVEDLANMAEKVWEGDLEGTVER